MASRSRILAIIVLGALASGPSVAGQTEKQRLQQLRQHIDTLNRQLDADRSSRDELRARMDAVEQRIAAISRDLAETRRAISRSNTELARLTEDQQRLAGTLKQRRDEIAALIRGAYMLGDHGYLRTLLNLDDPGSVGRISAYYRYFTEQRLNRFRKIESILAQTRQTRAALTAERRRLDQLESRQRVQQSSLAGERAERQSLLAQVEGQIRSRESELARLKKDESRLARLVRDLERHLASMPAKPGPADGFADMRGRLALPVAGPIGARFGEPKSNTGMSWQGLFLKAGEGETVRAVFRGRVVYADWLRGFGLLLIVDHSDGYMSLYSHNQVLDRQVGDWVETGEAIARVGTSGGLRQPGLYFEIRHKGKPRNPLRWCKLN